MDGVDALQSSVILSGVEGPLQSAQVPGASRGLRLPRGSLPWTDDSLSM